MNTSAPKVIVELQGDASASPLILEYEIFRSDFCRRWLGLLRNTLNKPHTIDSDGIFYGSRLDNEEEVVESMRKSINTINAYCIQNGHLDALIKMKPHVGMSQSFLNDLHGIFEKLEPQERFRSLLAGDEVHKAMLNLNLFIHKAEGFVPERPRNDSVHIEVIPNPVRHVRFHDADFDLFTLDWEFGGLYLTYGITGVPTINAYWADTVPRPQDRYSSGMFLGFYDSSKSSEREALGRWLNDKYHVDVNNPKAAVGYIQLGRITPPINDRENLIKSLAANKKIKKIRIEGLNPDDSFLDVDGFVDGETPINPLESLGRAAPTNNAARWPFDSEIFYHLDLVPYLDLKVPFDARAVLDEALAWREKSVVHRNYDQVESADGGKWKSLALRSLDGDERKTLYHWEYGIRENPNYEMTEIAKHCPETTKLLNRITDVAQCERIRFMYLEPGASINVHKDSDRDVSMAINISLNMPVGCTFHAQVNKDGTENPFSVRIPFLDSGSVMLFNNAKYHRVHNDSNVCRVHVILHGPIRFTDEQLIALARRQNGFSNRSDLVRRLIHKKVSLQEEIPEASSLFQDWLTLGLKRDSLCQAIGLVVVNNHSVDAKMTEEIRENITEASLFPLEYRICDTDALSLQAKRLSAEGKTHAVFIGSGTMLLDTSRFVIELTRCVMDLQKAGAAVSGHIMDYPEETKVPYLHEQFCIVDLRKWKELGWIPLGELFSSDQIVFPSYQSSSQKFHDEYTPYWIKPTDDKLQKRGPANWGTALMTECLKRKWEIRNVPESLRRVKKYAYALQGPSPQYADVKQTIADSLEITENQIYFFNNEPLTILNIPEFAPTQLISVAAGFKPARMIDQYWPPEKERRLVRPTFIDFSANAIEYMRGLVSCDDLPEIQNYIQRFSTQAGAPIQTDRIVSLLRTEVLPFFRDDDKCLLRALRLLRTSEFVRADFVNDPGELISQIVPGERPLIWTSNAFYNRSLYFVMNKTEAERRLRALLLGVAKKLKTRCWIFAKRTAVFGESPSKPIGLLTDGCVFQPPANIDEWQEIHE